MVRRALVVLLIAVAGAPAVLGAQQAPVPDLATIMRGPETVGREPGGVRWTPDSRYLHFSWLPPGTGWRESARPYRLREGMRHTVDGRRVLPGEIVHLTARGYRAFADKFEPVTEEVSAAG